MDQSTTPLAGYTIDDTIAFEDDVVSADPDEDCDHQPTPSVYYTMACTITSGLCPS